MAQLMVESSRIGIALKAEFHQLVTSYPFAVSVPKFTIRLETIVYLMWHILIPL
jgi:hypothetical protein